jgi:hypothetical protein
MQYYRYTKNTNKDAFYDDPKGHLIANFPCLTLILISSNVAEVHAYYCPILEVFPTTGGFSDNEILVGDIRNLLFSVSISCNIGDRIVGFMSDLIFRYRTGHDIDTFRLFQDQTHSNRRIRYTISKFFILNMSFIHVLAHMDIIMDMDNDPNDAEIRYW